MVSRGYEKSYSSSSAGVDSSMSMGDTDLTPLPPLIGGGLIMLTGELSAINIEQLHGTPYSSTVLT